MRRGLRYAGRMHPLMRHILACNTAHLPGDRLPFRLGAAVVGWVPPATAALLAGEAEVIADAAGVTVADATALPRLGRVLAEAGMTRWRDEAFDVRADADGPALGRIDRGAMPALGLLAAGVHVNGLVREAGGLSLWVGRRAATKALDPDKLDNIVAGGIPAGLTPARALVKEAAEEASIPADLAARAVPVGRIAYAMERPEGLRRDVLHCYDLDLPADFVPMPNDHEVARFARWPIAEVLAAVTHGEAFKFNVNLVLIDLFLRLDMIPAEPAAQLRAALRAPPPG